jgi:subtilase family serine protease
MNQTIVEQAISPPVVNEVFTVVGSGNYTLILTNLSSDTALEASILFGDRESYATQEQLIFSFLLYAGIIAIIAGAVITILDRRRINKMKQFGDTSDLV